MDIFENDTFNGEVLKKEERKSLGFKNSVTFLI